MRRCRDERTRPLRVDSTGNRVDSPTYRADPTGWWSLIVGFIFQAICDLFRFLAVKLITLVFHDETKGTRREYEARLAERLRAIGHVVAWTVAGLMLLVLVLFFI